MHSLITFLKVIFKIFNFHFKLYIILLSENYRNQLTAAENLRLYLVSRL